MEDHAWQATVKEKKGVRVSFITFPVKLES